MPGNTMPSGELQKAYIMGFTHATCSMFWLLTNYIDTKLFAIVSQLLKYISAGNGMGCGCFGSGYAPVRYQVRYQVKVLLRRGSSSWCAY